MNSNLFFIAPVSSYFEADIFRCLLTKKEART